MRTRVPCAAPIPQGRRRRAMARSANRRFPYEPCRPHALGRARRDPARLVLVGGDRQPGLPMRRWSFPWQSLDGVRVQPRGNTGSHPRKARSPLLDGDASVTLQHRAGDGATFVAGLLSYCLGEVAVGDEPLLISSPSLTPELTQFALVSGNQGLEPAPAKARHRGDATEPAQRPRPW